MVGKAKPKTKTVYRAVEAAKAVRRRAPRRAGHGLPAAGMTVAVGVAGGLAAQAAGTLHPVFGPPIGMAAVGYLGKNDALLTMAGVSLSRAIPIGGLLPGAGAPAGGFI